MTPPLSPELPSLSHCNCQSLRKKYCNTSALIHPRYREFAPRGKAIRVRRRRAKHTPLVITALGPSPERSVVFDLTAPTRAPLSQPGRKE
eukprot:scaffold137624_cov27-Tisochrysis_lutea.AAC.1